MYNDKFAFVNTKTVLCFPKIVFVFLAIADGAFGVPVHNKYFPEQDLVSNSDCQSFFSIFLRTIYCEN